MATEMAIALLKGLGDAAHLHRVDLSKKNINETAGRAFVTFLGKSISLHRFDISQNSILNITKNKSYRTNRARGRGGKAWNEEKGQKTES
jgi:hypothetical protein